MPDRGTPQYPRMSFVRGSLVPRTEFFTVENLPSLAKRTKNSLVAPILEQRYQQAQLNLTLWNEDKELKRITEIDFIYNQSTES